MAVEDTQAAAAAPEEGLSLDDLTEAAYGKAPDVAPCGEGTDTEVGASAVNSAASDDAPDAASEADDASEAQQTELTPEERELAENNALADVFDDVRRQSSDSQLVVPSRRPQGRNRGGKGGACAQGELHPVGHARRGRSPKDSQSSVETDRRR